MVTSAADLARIAELCNALADEARVEIVARLLDGEKCVCDLTDALETGQSCPGQLVFDLHRHDNRIPQISKPGMRQVSQFSDPLRQLRWENSPAR